MPSSTDTGAISRWIATLLVLLCALVIAVYLPGLGGGFVFDDNPNLVNNPDVRVENLSRDELVGAAFSSESGMLSRPLSMLSFALNFHFFGDGPFSFKLVNLLVHLGTGIAVFWLTRLLVTGLRRRGQPMSPALENGLPVAVAAIWLLHPIQLVAILHVVQRMTSLGALFTVLGLCCYTAGRLRDLDGRRGGLALMIAGIMGFGLLSTLSKENGVLLPLYAFVIETSLFRLRSRTGSADRQVIVLFVVTLALPAMAAFIWLAMEPSRFLGGYAVRDFTLVERLLTEARVLVFYLKNILAPSITDLGLFHDDFTVSRGLLRPATTLAAIAFHAVLIGAAWVALRRAPLFAMGVLWFYAGHVMESTILPLELVHEHRNYLPAYGIVVALVSVVLSPRAARSSLPTRIAGLALLAFGIALVTAVRAYDWRNQYAHAESEARHHPDSPRALYTAGRALGELAIRGNAGAYGEAVQYLSRAGKRSRDSIMPEAGLLVIATRTGHPADPAWIQAIHDKLSSNPPVPATTESLKQLLRCAPAPCLRQEELERMIRTALERARQSNLPGASAPYLAMLGEFLITQRGDYATAEGYFREAARAAANRPQFRTNLVNLLMVTGQLDAAEREIAVLRNSDRFGRNRNVVATLEKDLATIRSLPPRRAGTERQ